MTGQGSLPAGFVLDGSNLARLLPGSCLQAIDRVIAALLARHPCHRCLVMCDPSLRRQIAAVDRAEFERRLASGHWLETSVAADLAILRQARSTGAVVVSRDRFRDQPAERADVPVLTVSTGPAGVQFDAALMHTSDGRLVRVDVEQHLATRSRS